MTDDPFDAWLDELRKDVFEDERGYERGEFTVYPEAWRSYYEAGFTPSEACEHALHGRHGCEMATPIGPELVEISATSEGDK